MKRLPHVLLINIDYPPDITATAPIVQELAEALAQRYRVTVITGRPSYNPSERHPYYLLRHEEHGQLRIIRVGSTAFPRKRVAGRLANYLSYVVLALLRGLLVRPDVVIAMTSPPLAGLIGAIIARLRRCPLVYNIHDLHPDMALAAGLIHPGPLATLWEKTHRWVLRRARLVLVLGEDMRERVMAKSVDPGRVIVVRTGASLLDCPQVDQHATVEMVRGGYPFVVLHAGNLGFAGAWETVLGGARLLQERPIGVVFVGEGVALDRLKEAAKGIPNLRFLPFFPRQEIPLVLRAPDLHVITLKRGLEGLVVPSKTYSILAAGRPILAVAPEGSDVVRIVRRFQCGLVADPDDPAGVARAVLWARDHPEELAAMAQRARVAAVEFDRRVLLQEFVQTIKNVMNL